MLLSASESVNIFIVLLVLQSSVFPVRLGYLYSTHGWQRELFIGCKFETQQQVCESRIRAQAVNLRVNLEPDQPLILSGKGFFQQFKRLVLFAQGGVYQCDAVRWNITCFDNSSNSLSIFCAVSLSPAIAMAWPRKPSTIVLF